MGSGKTKYAIDMILNNPDKKYIYITPFLSEVQRVLYKINDNYDYNPKKDANRVRKQGDRIVEPQNIKGTKLEGLKNILRYGNSIVTTHQLLKRFDLELQEMLMVGDYTLILDEVMEVVHPFSFPSASDKDTFFNHFGYTDEEGYLCWREDLYPPEEYKGRFTDIMNLCINRNLIMIAGTAYLWELPVNLFKCFSEIYILTFLFQGSYQKHYFDLFKVQYDYYSIKDDKLVKYEPVSKETLQELKGLINIYEGNLNNIGDTKFSLASTWCSKNIKKKDGVNSIYLDSLKNNTYNYFFNIVKGKSDSNMWSCFKPYKSLLSGKGYSKGFVEFNTRATNEFIHKSNIAYLVNIFCHPSMSIYFKQKGIDLDEDSYALSILIQFIWRSRIRDTKLPLEDRKINIFIPSLRMRNLLKNFLEKGV